MEFKETVKKIKENVMNDGYTNIFLEKYVAHTLETIDDLERGLSSLMDEDSSLSKEEIDKISKKARTTNRILLTLQCTRRIEDSTRDFLKQYSLLSYNWGNAVKNEEVVASIKAVKNMTETTKTLKELIEESKILVRYVEQFNTFNPPAFQVSKSYLEGIYEAMKEGEDLNDRNK